MRTLRAWWSRIAGFIRPGAGERDFDDELQSHIGLHTDDNIRAGMTPDEARRQALARLGTVAGAREAHRDRRGLPGLEALFLDLKLGGRMLVKYPGLTIVGGFAMAVAIAVGATAFEAISDIVDSALPFPGGDRVVTLELVGSDPGQEENKVVHEFAALRGQLTTVEHFGAYSNVQHNLVAAETAPEPVEVAEISASAFAITNTPALRGRYLVPSDEADDASPAVVIGYQAWQLRFGGDPNVVGRTVRLGGVSRTVVGVMPEGFEFPTDHQFWIPLRVDPLKYAKWEGPSLAMFGRLAPGVTIEQAQAEFAAVAQRTAVPHPETGLPLRPMVTPYTQVVEDPAMLWALRAGQLVASALTVVVAINLAILVYARTVTRRGEIAVRSALGASRRRILAQLFSEALALALVGAAAGLGLARYALGVIQTLNDADGLPYWISFGLSPGTVIFALGLAVLSAFIMGVLPGLKATRVGLSANLHELHGRSGTRLGATWTMLIVAQVAVAVAVLPAAVFVASRVIRMELAGAGFPVESIVAGYVGLSADAPPVNRDRLAAQQRELLARLAGEPGVSRVAFSSGMPGFGSTRAIRFQNGVRVRAGADYIPDIGITDALLPSMTTVSVDLFAAYGVEILAGRDFAAGDVGTTNVIVNRSFVDTYLQEPNVVGLLFHYESKRPEVAQVWYQVVGVVRDFPAFPLNFQREREPTIYHPAGVGDFARVLMSVRFAGEVPPAFINRFRDIGAEVDPTLQLTSVGVMADLYDDLRMALRSLAWVASLLTASVLLLSAAGIYSLMSFTVAQRRREIGIRMALGAPPQRVMLNVFGRAAWQVSAGVVVGSVLSAGSFVAIGLGVLSAMPLQLAVAALMALVALLATLGPTRRAVRIQAVEALRTDG
ncbi:MAG TPA: FtsX-like permease family protein [Vicinamibacterales bacterium]|nr:FtsX-like permease family protein [Vicinamibacterales bacterium]